ncbi:MAG: FliJ family protein [Epsilonproteobacteria bacterium]|nr:FliJ family protein [Campylobacterota bacterium]
MKTKYSQLVKIRKQKVDSIENIIAVLNRYKDILNSDIESILKQIKEIEVPKKGEFVKFLSRNYTFETLMNRKREKELQLRQKEEEIKIAQQEHKKALIEYEKVKYLEDVVIQEKLKKMQKEEEKMLDEVSIITYKRRHI